MPTPYFRQVPDFEYVSRLPNAKISDYIRVKNLFKRGKLADDIFPNLNFFTKYQIEGDDRPDNVAFKVYDEPKEIMDFIKQYIDYDRLFEGALQKKINMFYGAMSWDLPVDKKNTLERFF